MSNFAIKGPRRLKDVIDGKLLIYAEGERDQLANSHGASYCASLLFASYFEHNVTFSMENPGEYNIFLNKKNDQIEVTATPLQSVPANEDRLPPSAEKSFEF